MTIPASTSTLQAGVTWNTVTNGEIIYLNEFEITKLTTATPEYQYHLKDHLGNIRVTFTSKDETDTYTATLEDNTQAAEQAAFKNYSRVTADIYDHTDAGTTYDKAQILNGGNNSQVGLTKTLAVMPGDVVSAEVYAKYFESTAKFYGEDGTLREIQFFDDFGRMIDYKKFKRDGKQNLDIQTRLPIILSVRDTVNEGDYYLSEIRLGNRRFNTIEVIIGNHDDPALLGKPRLPMKDSVTALLKIKAGTVGRNILEGVIIEINDASRDSLLVIPFSKAFYVKEGPTSSL